MVLLRKFRNKRGILIQQGQHFLFSLRRHKEHDSFDAQFLTLPYWRFL
jgi:hypothetical protein